jgi:nucleotide-binding universal stress UspA family protein
MSKRLLIAVTGSAAATAALHEAIELAKRDDSEMHLVHVFDETSVGWGERGVAQRRQALNALGGAGDKALTDAQDMIRAAGRRASCARLRRERTGDTVSALIAAEAEAWGADLIVVGSRGYGPIRRALHASVDAAVIRVATVPVLPVKPADTQRASPGRLPSATPDRLGLA